jgi:hypothetical protein
MMADLKHSLDSYTITSIMKPHVRDAVTVTLDPRVDVMDLLAESHRIEVILDGLALVEPEISPRSLGVIGAGNGIETIGAGHIFHGLDQIILADRDMALLLCAAVNVRNNVPRGVQVEMRGSAVNLLTPHAALGRKVDLLYVNLLNPPYCTVIDPDSEVPPVTGTAEDDMLNGYLLNLPYHFLRALPEVLNPGGSALMLIAGRFPFAILDRLAAAANVRFEEVNCGLDHLTDPMPVLSTYAAAERGEFRFFFYNYGQAKAIPRDGDIPVTGGTLARYLSSARLSARLALEQFKTSIEIGSIFHMLRVTPVG